MPNTHNTARSNERGRARSWLATLVALYLPALVFLAVVVMVCVSYEIDPGFLLRDPTATMDASPYTGMVSSLGILLWSASTTLFLFGAAAVWRSKNNGFAGFLLYFGLLSLLLTLDDLFLIHEELVYHQLDLSEKLMSGIYAILTLVGAWIFRKQVRKTDYRLLLVAVSFLALSAIIDKYLSQSPSEWRIMFEDGFKFLGIVGWLGYSWKTVYAQATRLLSGRVADL